MMHTLCCKEVSSQHLFSTDLAGSCCMTQGIRRKEIPHKSEKLERFHLHVQEVKLVCTVFQQPQSGSDVLLGLKDLGTITQNDNIMGCFLPVKICMLYVMCSQLPNPWMGPVQI